jgi:hypothetical protein
MLAALSSTNWPSVDQLAIIGAFSVPIVVIAGGLWYKIRKMLSENDLKRTMVERGMSVEEIERVLAARSPDHISGTPEISRESFRIHLKSFTLSRPSCRRLSGELLVDHVPAPCPTGMPAKTIS